MGWNTPSAELMNDIIVGILADISEDRADTQRDFDRLRKQAEKPHKVQR